MRPTATCLSEKNQITSAEMGSARDSTNCHEYHAGSSAASSGMRCPQCPQNTARAGNEDPHRLQDRSVVAVCWCISCITSMMLSFPYENLPSHHHYASLIQNNYYRCRIF